MRRALRAAWFVLMALTVIVSLMPMPEVPVSIDHFDKIEHGVGYAILAAIGVLVYPAWRACLAVFVLGAAIEGLQLLVPWRSGGDVYDVLANTVGIAIGALAALPLRHRFA